MSNAIILSRPQNLKFCETCEFFVDKNNQYSMQGFGMPKKIYCKSCDELIK